MAKPTRKKAPLAPAPAKPIAVAVPQATEVTPEALAKVDPKGTYQVQMRRTVKYANTWLRPNAPRIRVSGAALLALANQGAVRAFVPV